MKKSLIFVITSIALIILIIFGVFFLLKNHSEAETAKVCIKERCFNAKIAKTEVDREKGLSNVPYLPENESMLFLFDKPGIYPFWMKDTIISLDMVWIDENLKIVKIEKNAQPCTPDSCHSINPGKNALYVLEINGHLSDKYGFVEGDAVTITIRSNS